ncbi:MAG: FliM/FliN family flagellar motor switch protein [Dethiobacteraceae bacterium]|jgi:flagellar motor switch protein FliN/FliY|nr:flagellar motor switch protein FliN [Bacillota bacterium]
MSDVFLSQAEIDALLPPAAARAESGEQQAAAAKPADYAAAAYAPQQLARVLDLPMQLTAKLGEISLTLAEVLALNTGSIVEFGHAANKPLDICLNGKLIARGEVIIVDEHFALRVTEVAPPAEIAHKMGATK